MFWRFGFHNASSIENLLDKDDVVLEALLDEDDLLQECKAQNTRLIDYFQRQDVLKQLFGYVTGQIEPEEGKRFKYPYVATEVLCSDIWSIVEACTTNQDTLLRPFWEGVLEHTPDDMKMNMILAANFAKINSVFLNKKPAEMLAFVQAQPDVINRIIRLIETPAFVDLLVRIIQLDEQPGCDTVLEWLSEQRLIPRLVELLSPHHSSDKHAVVTDLIKGITSMANPSPGAGMTEGLQNGPSSNRFARELVKPDMISQLMNYIVADFGPQSTTSALKVLADPPPDAGEGKDNMSWSISSQPPLPTLESHTSSVVSSIAVVVEVIRKNNSDYFEPYLFHVLRNRLMQVQQQMDFSDGDYRQALEPTMQAMVDKLGVVHFGPLLEVMCNQMELLQGFTKQPRSLTGPVNTTVGAIQPLTLERYRVIELFAELLHCSNMTLLNRPSTFADMYDADGRLQGGLEGMERLGQVISPAQRRDEDDNMDDVEPAMEFPVSSASRNSPSGFDSDDDMGSEPGSSDDEAMEEIVMAEDPSTSVSASPASQRAPLSASPQTSAFSCSPRSSNFSTSPNAGSTLSSSPETSTTVPSLISDSTESIGSTAGARSRSRRSSRRRTTMEESVTATQMMPIGEQLKQRWLDLDILSSIMDLFFEFPWNNFLHSAVYDIIHQIFTGPAESGLNRELALSLFRDAKLMHRIVAGQKRNDEAAAQPKGVRLGYMGHLTLIAEDVINWLEQLPTDARSAVLLFAPVPEWEEYVTGRYNETKARDTALLGGGKPDVARGTGGASRWKVDEEDAKGTAAAKVKMDEDDGEMKGEFRRATSARPRREGSADFGPAPIAQDEDEDEGEGERRAEPFARYLAQEIGTTAHFENSEESDEDEDDAGWLSQNKFMRPPVSSQQRPAERRPLAEAFGDTFDPGPSNSPGAVHSNPFESDEDTFGAFTSDPEPEDGELTPTTGSWTFASGSTTSVPSDEEKGGEEKRTA
ncbi:SIT4 phosphatase-associated protein-domain-containing protein [Schizophyllum amplum]|uniref:SIT4 phosphatase-associated protein-domain-containing protein n=1 Tax=Schizophyllum amplum TaxID=97359 RepID=A0A550C8W2_9AGAR|nr:SIT4 phosphatase-associated protein-domain-containing protein [Auriculariopsis ampla]